MGRKRDIVVVTSNSLEQQLAFQRGALRMSSFDVKEAEEKIKIKTEKIIRKKDIC